MRRVLCLFYYFPPTGGAGALRCGGMARELLPRGWAASVVAGSVRHHTPGEDLLARIPAEVTVRRTPAWDLRRLWSPLRHLGVPETAVAGLSRAFLCHADYALGWAPFARKAAETLLAEGRFDALLSYGAPWSAHLVAMDLARRHRLPWLAGFADPWSTSDEVRWPSPLHRRWARHWEGRVLARADAVLPVTEGVAEALRRAHPGLSPRLEGIRNGYDEPAFSGLLPKQANRFTLVHAGTAYPGSSPGPLLDLLAALVARHPEQRGKLRLRLLGHAATDLASRAARLGIQDLVVLEGPRPHAEAVRAMVDAHAIACVFERPGHALARPMKLLDALRAGPSVLGIFPEGEASRLLARFPDCAWLKPGDLEGGVRTLSDWMTRWEAGTWPDTGLRPGVEDLSRSAEAGKLAALLDTLSAG